VRCVARFSPYRLTNSVPLSNKLASDVSAGTVSVGDLSLSLISGSLTAKDLSIGAIRSSARHHFSPRSHLALVSKWFFDFSKALNVTGITSTNRKSRSFASPPASGTNSSLGDNRQVAPKALPRRPPRQMLSVKKLELKNENYCRHARIRKAKHLRSRNRHGQRGPWIQIPVAVSADFPAAAN